MKNIFFSTLVILLVSTQAQAVEKLLDCNTPVGPDQGISVVVDDGVLYLKEVTTGGAMLKRELDQQEWESKKLTLRQQPGVVSTIEWDGSGWWISSVGPGASGFGYAQCD